MRLGYFQHVKEGILCILFLAFAAARIVCLKVCTNGRYDASVRRSLTAITPYFQRVFSDFFLLPILYGIPQKGHADSKPPEYKLNLTRAHMSR